MNILVSSDANYLSITATMLYSVAMYNDELIHVWFLNHRVPLKQQQMFSEYLSRKCNIDVTFVDMDDELFVGFELPIYIKHISVETYYRLVAQFVLPPDLDRILWLDSDIIVKGNLELFYHQDINNIPLVACVNMGESRCGFNNQTRLGLPNDYFYFNAGVILFNLDYLRKNTTLKEIAKLCNNNKERFRLQDQDVLNVMFYKNARVLMDQMYNCLVNSPDDFITPNICEKTYVIHYAGMMKPWKIQWQDAYSKYYWAVKEEEGLSIRERLIKVGGLIWGFLRINTIIKWLCAPYYWLLARI